MPKDLTVAELERLLERQRKRLEGLFRRRDSLRKQLAAVEHRIVSLGGSAPKGRKKTRRRRKRPRNSKSLLQYVIDVLSQNKKGVTLRELAAGILEAGYKTVSENFENTVYQIIYNNRTKVMHDARTRTYRLK